MGFFDRFKTSSDQPAGGTAGRAGYRALPLPSQTAPPEAIEQAHAEAFARLTPEQRQLLLKELGSDMPDAERTAAYRAARRRARLRVSRRARNCASRVPWSARGTAWAPPRRRHGLRRHARQQPDGQPGRIVLGTMIAQQFFAHTPEASHLFGGPAGSEPQPAISQTIRGQRLDQHGGDLPAMPRTSTAAPSTSDGSGPDCGERTVISSPR